MAAAAEAANIIIMCGCKDCQGITLLKGTDGNGIVSITDNGDGTLTILYTDGTIYITPNFTGPQGEQGVQGIQGPAGVNAFKFTQQFTMVEGSSVTIARSALTTCGVIPLGCLGRSTSASLMDLHIQIWTSNAEVVTTTWAREDVNNTFSITINDVTGLITITRVVGSIDLYVRVVILA